MSEELASQDVARTIGQLLTRFLQKAFERVSHSLALVFAGRGRLAGELRDLAAKRRVSDDSAEHPIHVPEDYGLGARDQTAVPARGQ